MKKLRLVRYILISVLFAFFTASGLWGTPYSWSGGAGGDWTDGRNWGGALSTDPSPVGGDDVSFGNYTVTLTNIPSVTFASVTINGASANITLSSNLSTTSLAITDTGAVLDVNDCTLAATTFSNKGTLRLKGSENLSGLTNDTANGGTVEYYGGSTFSGWTSFANLIVSDGTHTLTAATNIGGTLKITAPGNISQGTGTITVSGITTIDVGTSDLSLPSTGNKFSEVDITSGKNISLADANDIIFGSSTVTGSLTINSTGTVTQSGVISASGLELLGVGGIFTLNTQNNAITTLAGDTGVISFKDNTGFAIGTVNSTAGLTTSGNTTLSSTGTVTQSDVISASGLELLGAGGTFTLNTLNNAITTLAGNTGSVSFQDNTGFAIGTVTTAGLTTSANTTLSCTGTVTQSQPIQAVTLTLDGAAGIYTLNTANNAVTTLDANNDTLGTLKFRNDSSFAIAGITTGTNTTTLSSTGTVTQSGIISASGLELLGAGGTFTLDTQNNAITTLAGNTGSVSFQDNAGFAIGTVTTVGLTTTGNTTLSCTGTVTQTQIIKAAGLDLLGAGGTFTLNTLNNAITTLAGNTGAVSFQDNTGFAIGTVITAGLTTSANTTLSCTGTVTQSQPIQAVTLTLDGAAGIYTLNTANNAVTTLDANNDTLGTLKFRNDSSFAIAGITTGTNTTTLSSTGTVTQSGIISASGLELLGAGGTFTLDTQNNAITTLAGNTGSVSFQDNAGFAIGTVTTAGLTTTGNTTLSCTGTVTQTQIIKAAGLDLLGAGGTFTLDTQDNAITTLAGNTGEVSFKDNAGFAIGTVTTTGLTTSKSGGIKLTGNSIDINAAVKTTGNGTFTCTNSGVLTIAAAGDFTLSGAFVQDGTGDSLVAGDITISASSAADAISFAGRVIINGGVAFDTSSPVKPIRFGTGNDVFIGYTTIANTTFNAGTSTVIFGKNVHIYAPGSTISFESNTIAVNFVKYAGIINMNSKTLQTTQDLVLFGGDGAGPLPDYSADDTTDTAPSGVSGLFSYDNAERTSGSSALILADPHVALITTIPIPITPINFTSTNYSGFVQGLGGATLTVGMNFYANGGSLDAGGSNWNLIIPNNDDAKVAFAEAYNLQIDHGQVTGGWVSAAENCSGTVCSGWDFDRPQILADDGSLGTGTTLSGTYTVYDDVIRVEFYDGKAGPLTAANLKKIENSNNEIFAAVTNIKFSNGTYSFNGSFTNPECTTSTNGQGDLSFFYLKTNSATPTERWNTDAKGTDTLATLNPDSTDRGRPGAGNGPANRTTIPNIDIPKALGAIYQTLRDEHKNRIRNYSTAKSNCFTATTDHCRPVLVEVHTGQELHTSTLASQTPYDAHNFIEFHWSEPVNIGGFDSQANFPGWTNPTPNTTIYKRSQDTFATASEYGGAITGTLGITITGYATITNGSITTGDRGPYPGTITYDPLNATLNNTVHALYRYFSIDGTTAAALQKNRLRISIAGWCDNLSGNWFWEGFIDDPTATPTTTPSGTVTVPSNPYIKDRSAAKNILEPTAYILATETATGTTSYGDFTNAPGGRQRSPVTVSSTTSNLYSAWDTQPPELACLTSSGTPALSGEYEALPRSSGGTGLFNDLELHFFDNTYSLAGSYKWYSKDGWYNGASLVVTAPEAFGGKRPDSGATSTSGGIRDNSMSDSMNAFRVTTSTGASLIPISWSTIVSSSFMAPSTNSLVDDPYCDFSFTPSVPINSAWFKISYTPATDSSGTGFVTDLAGNRLKAISDLLCLTRTPPELTFALAGVGRNDLYLLFSKDINLTQPSNYMPPPAFDYRSYLAAGIEITIPSHAGQFNPTSVSPVNGNSRALLCKLPYSITAEDIVSSALAIKIIDAGDPTISDPDTLSPVHCTRFRDATDNYVTINESHRLTDLGIGLVDILYGSDGVNTPGLLKEGTTEGALRVFDGTGRLLDRDITIATHLTTNSAAVATKPLTMFFDVNPSATTMPTLFNAATGLSLKLWLPSVLPSFNSLGNMAARTLSPVSIADANQLFRNFLIPEADPEVIPGSNIQMIFQYGDLYCARLTNANDITSVAPWSFNISQIKLQRGGVTILNNVINANNGEKTILQVDVSKAGNIVIQVFTLDGNVVKVLERGLKGGGTYTYYWDGTNGAGNAVARGMYFIRVVGPDMDEIRKVMVVKD